MALHQEFLGESNSRKNLDDFFGGESVAVRIGHAAQGFPERRAFRGAERLQNRVGIWSGVQNVSRAFPSLLTQADIYGWQGERGSFHDAAAGISEEDVHLAEKAPVGKGVEVYEYVRIRAGGSE